MRIVIISLLLTSNIDFNSKGFFLTWEYPEMFSFWKSEPYHCKNGW